MLPAGSAKAVPLCHPLTHTIIVFPAVGVESKVSAVESKLLAALSVLD